MPWAEGDHHTSQGTLAFIREDLGAVCHLAEIRDGTPPVFQQFALDLEGGQEKLVNVERFVQVSLQLGEDRFIIGPLRQDGLAEVDDQCLTLDGYIQDLCAGVSQQRVFVQEMGDLRCIRARGLGCANMGWDEKNNEEQQTSKDER